MDDQNRVLVRNGARELTHEEVERISGGIRTLTPCTIGPSVRQRDGDASIGEC
jgi:hypothetical protein